MGKSSPTTQTTTTSESRQPWKPTIDPLKGVINTVTKNATADMFTPRYSAQTMAGLQGLESAASGPSAGTAAAGYGQDVLGRGAPVGIDQLIATANGQNLNGNPYIMQALSYGQDDLQRRINEQFAGAGRLGSGANQQVMSDALLKNATNTLMGNYNTERGYQINAADRLAGLGGQTASMASAIDSGALFPHQLMMDVGQTRESMDQATRMAPLTAAQYQSGAIAPLAGLGGTSNGTSTTTMQPPKPSIPGMILGGAMMGGSMFSGMGGFGMPGFGAGAGPMSGRWPY